MGWEARRFSGVSRLCVHVTIVAEQERSTCIYSGYGSEINVFFMSSNFVQTYDIFVTL